MEILVNIGIISLGAIIGAVIMSTVFAKRYSYILDDIYTRGLEDGREQERQAWLRIKESDNKH